VLVSRNLGERVRILLQIHDELIFEVENTILKEVAEKLKHVMETAFPLNIPIIVEVRTGQNLGAMKTVPQ